MEQLYKKQNGQYIKVYPLNYIENILDSESGKTLTSILSNFNNIYLPYQDNAQDTRALVPQVLRRKGLWITYNNGKDYITEYYKGTASDIQEHWTDDSNWEIVPSIKYVQENASKLPNGIITADKLSPALQELIKQGNTIINLPDDEDLEEVNSVLRFKDRKYNPELASGKGYKILRKNWTKIGSKMINLLTQDMINDSNTIYEIRYDFDLNGSAITIPKDSDLNFNGGRIINGIIEMSDDTLTLPGIGEVENFGAVVDDESFNDLNNTAFKNCLRLYKEIHLRKGTYYLTTGDDHNRRILNHSLSLYGYSTTINFDKYISDRNMSTFFFLINNIDSNLIVKNINFIYDIGDTQDYTAKSGNYYIISYKLANSVLIDNCTLYSDKENNGVTFISSSGSSSSKCASVSVTNCRCTTLTNSYRGGFIWNMVSNDHVDTSFFTVRNCYVQTQSKDESIVFSTHAKNTSANINIENCTFVSDNSIIQPISFIIINHDNFEDNIYLYCKDCTFTNNGDYHVIVLRNTWDIPSGSDLEYKYTNNSVNIFDNCTINYPHAIDATSVVERHYGIFMTSHHILICNNCDINVHSDYSIFPDHDGQVAYYIEYNNCNINGLIRKAFNRTIKANINSYFNNCNIIGDIYEVGIYNGCTINGNIVLESGYALYNRFFNTIINNTYIDDSLNLRFHEQSMYNINEAWLPKYAVINDVEDLRANFTFTGYSLYKQDDISINASLSVNPKDGLNVLYLKNDETDEIVYIHPFYFNYKTNEIIKYNKENNSYTVEEYINKGITANRPVNPQVGFQYFDTTLNKPIWWSNARWIDSEGNNVNSTSMTSGTFADKPTEVEIGYAYFCTDKQTTEGSTNGIMIYYKGDNVWVDALGRVIN